MKRIYIRLTRPSVPAFALMAIKSLKASGFFTMMALAKRKASAMADAAPPGR
jgi:hypothetical protein